MKASNDGRLNVSASELMSNYTITVNVTGLRVFAVRRWLGLLFIGLGVRVLGCGVEIKE